MKQLEITINVNGRKVKLEYVPCNLCGSNNTKEVFRARDERFDTCDYEFSIVECKSCGLAYVNPRPNFESIQAFYPPRFFEHRDDSERARSKYKEELRRVSRTSGRLLDVGCANGGFVRYAQNHGFNAEGLETAEYAQNPYNLRIHCTFDNLPDATFDVVTAWAVFEHLHDPMRYFREIERILKRGGKFLFLVPNFDSYRSKAMMYEDIPRHLYFYTPRTVRQYLSKVDLELEYIEQDNSIYYGGHRKFLVYLGLRLIGRQFTRRHQENLWYAFHQGRIPLWELIYLTPFEHFDRLIHRKVTKWFAQRGMNGTMVVHARKLT